MRYGQILMLSGDCNRHPVSPSLSAPLLLGLSPVALPRAEQALLQVHTRYFALKVDLAQFCGALRLVKSEASIARGPSS